MLFVLLIRIVNVLLLFISDIVLYFTTTHGIFWLHVASVLARLTHPSLSWIFDVHITNYLILLLLSWTTDFALITYFVYGFLDSFLNGTDDVIVMLEKDSRLLR